MTSIQNFSSRLVAAGFALLFFSCSENVETKEQEEVLKPVEEIAPVFTPFKIMVVRQAVSDFDKWKVNFIANDSLRTAYDISDYIIGRGLDDPKMVFIVEKIKDVKKTKDFSNLPSRKLYMQKAGLVGKSFVVYADVIRNDDTRIDQKESILVAQRVKDFDAWLKVYDAEGTAKRMENGLIDRALARGTDDPNMVYIVFAIADMAKAKARINSAELKKIMNDAGVTRPPHMFYYKIVD